MEHWFALAGDERDSSRFDEFLGNDEFELVRSRPSSLPHAVFLGKFRTLMAGMGGSPAIVAAVARLLESSGFLTSEEADWLETAGPAWKSHRYD
jgi:hypothetical protein